MSTQETLKTAASVLDGLELLQKITHVGGSTAEATLHAATKIIDVLVDGLHGKLSRTQIDDAIVKFRADLRGNDAAADSRLDAKFPK